MKALAAGLAAAFLAVTAAPAALAAAPAPAPVQSVGACAWAKVSTTDKTVFATAYHDDPAQGLATIGARSLVYQDFVATCLGRTGAPSLWADSVVGAQAIQEAALAELKTLKGLDRDAMERAWSAAPETARACTRSNAAKIFGIDGGTCLESRAPLAFLAPLHIVVAPEDQDLVRQALYYFTAKAQAEWAEQLLAKFKTDGLPPKTSGPVTTVR